MAITPKDWKDSPDVTTPLSAAALEDMETRLGAYTDTQVATRAALSHTHPASDVASGTMATARLGSGSASSTTFLRGDQTWAVPSGVTVQEEGSSLTQRNLLNFIGPSVTAVDNATSSATDITIRVQAERKRLLWLPGTVTDENYPREQTTNTAVTMTSGTMRVLGRFVVPSGVTVSSVSFHAAASSSSLTNHWGALIRQSDRSVLAKSADGTTTQIVGGGGSSLTTYTLSWAASVETAVYVGFVQVGSGMATLSGVTSSSNLTFISPAVVGTTTTGLTDPSSLGATAAAIVAAAATPWAAITYA